MPYLGSSYRIVYAARDFATGVANITARVRKPDGSVVGALPLLALPGGSAFDGLYYADLVTQDTDPEGEYIGVVSSPDEGIKRVFRVHLEQDRRATVERYLSALVGMGGVRGEVGADGVAGAVGGDSAVGIVDDEG